MALILNIETSSGVCSVGLCNNTKLICLKETTTPFTHSSSLTVFISYVLEKSKFSFKQLDAVGISMGPGSFTGLRLGMAVAKGICYSNNIPLIGINTLDAMAAGFINIKPSTKHLLLCPLIDSQRMEVFTALFDHNLSLLLDPCSLILDPLSFSKFLDKYKIAFFGNGTHKFQNLISHPNATFFTGFINSASHMSFISESSFNNGNFENLAYVSPLYFKDINTS